MGDCKLAGPHPSQCQEEASKHNSQKIPSTEITLSIHKPTMVTALAMGDGRMMDDSTPDRSIDVFCQLFTHTLNHEVNFFTTYT